MVYYNYPAQAWRASKLSSPNLPPKSIRRKGILTCFRLSTYFPSTKIHVWEPNPLCDGVQRGVLWQERRIGGSHEGPPPRWVGALRRQGLGWSSLSSWSKDTAERQPPAHQEEVLTETQICKHLDLGLPSLRTCEKSLSSA